MISHELKTIFVHIPRTGGTSVEIALVGNNWWKIDARSKHIDWRQAKKLYSDFWDDYLKFSIVRNPWDWLASLYFSHDRGGAKTWEEFVRQPEFYPHEQPSCLQSEIVGDEMDFILRFETLQEDFMQLTKKLGIDRELPHVQLGEGAHQHYSELYDDELAQVVSARQARDIERFRYKFITPEIAVTQQYKQEISRLKARVAWLEHELKAQID
jgi:hypothetical protein